MPSLFCIDIFVNTPRPGCRRGTENPFARSRDWDLQGRATETAVWLPGGILPAVSIAGLLAILVTGWPEHVNESIEATKARLKVGGFDESRSLPAWRRSVVEPASDGGAEPQRGTAEPYATPGDFVLLAREVLAEVSGFAYRARSLLCKRQIRRQTASSEGAGRRAEFRRMEAAGCAVLRSMQGAVGGLNSSGPRGGILPGSRLSQSVFRMVFTFPLWRASPPCSVDEPGGWTEVNAPGFGATPNPRIATQELATLQARAALADLRPYVSKLGRAILGRTALNY